MLVLTHSVDRMTIDSQPTQRAIVDAQEALLELQGADGYWCADLLADTTLNSDYIMLLNFLGNPSPGKIQKLANFIVSEQLPDGGWPIYLNGPAEITATLKAYWALKFAGFNPRDELMQRARHKLNELGGIHQINTFAKFYLAIFGLYDWRGVPTIPPEMIFFPQWIPFNIYEFSSWSRTIIIPLSIVNALKHSRPAPEYARLDELFPDKRRFVPLKETIATHNSKDLFWHKFFLSCDRSLKVFENFNVVSLRRMAINRAEQWISEHQKGSSGLSAIFPSMLNTIFAYKALGYANDYSGIQAELTELEKFEVQGPGYIRLQPCVSPIWDTAISINALIRSGLASDHLAIIKAAKWLVNKETKIRGDWSVKNPSTPAGGWYFELNNPWYPDVDDTIMVLLALERVKLNGSTAKERDAACQRGLNWTLSMQCRNGGWGAFDKDNTKEILTKLPFADHNAMIDPPTADLTGRMLELLGNLHRKKSYSPASRAITFLKREQEDDGSWYGRWGVNYIYGTSHVLQGLSEIGEDINLLYVRKAVNWLMNVQNEDGGWGETCETYENPERKGCGPSTPSQTAWALLGLLAAADVTTPAIQRGIKYLLTTQNEHGTWDEFETTGTGFPKVFYLEYTMYRLYFPLLALGTYQSHLRQQKS